MSELGSQIWALISELKTWFSDQILNSFTNHEFKWLVNQDLLLDVCIDTFTPDN